MPGAQLAGLLEMTVVMQIAMSGALVVFLVIYVLGVLRTRNGQPDPLLGLKVLLTLLLTAAFETIVLGLAVFLGSLLDGEAETAVKQGLAMMVGGSFAGIYPGVVFLQKVGFQSGEPVQRQAIGFNAIITGLAFVGGITFLSVQLFNSENVTAPLGITASYGAGHTACLLMLLLQATPTQTAAVHEARPAQRRVRRPEDYDQYEQ